MQKNSLCIKRSFPLTISSVNVTKSAGNCIFCAVTVSDYGFKNIFQEWWVCNKSMKGAEANGLSVSHLNIVNTTWGVYTMEGFRKKETIIDLCLDREYTSDIYSPEKRWNFFKSCTIEEVIYSSVFILDKSHILMAKRSQNRILLYLRWSKF